ncbi:D-alanyl carrier protein [Paenibacillus xylanexedens]|nr:D-alanyl carrier protein [Paenibacillus xylanexedens]
MNEIKLKVRNFLTRFVGPNELKDTDNIFELNIVNSLFAMQLVHFLESEYKIIFTNQELDISNFQSLEAIANIVFSKLTTKNTNN